MPDAHMLAVDDSSPDSTADVARSLGAELGNVDELGAQHTAGLGGAYRAGFRLGLERGYGTIVEMDADLSHAPETLPTLLSRWGSRYAAFVLGISVSDATSGYRAYRADGLERAGYAATTTAVEALGLSTWWGIRDRSRDLYHRVRGRSTAPEETT